MTNSIDQKENYKKIYYTSLAIIIFLMLLLILSVSYIFSVDNRFINNNSYLYKITDGKETKVDPPNCNYPNKVIGLRCCVKDEHFYYMCTDEAESYQLRLKNLIDNKIVSNSEIISNDFLGINFESPKNYYLLKNERYGKISVPYSYYSIDNINLNSSNDVISIYYFGEGLSRSKWSTFARTEFNNGIIVKTKNNYEIAKTENTITGITENGKINHGKLIIIAFLDYPFMIDYKSLDGNLKCESDLDNLVNSFVFKNNQSSQNINS